MKEKTSVSVMPVSDRANVGIFINESYLARGRARSQILDLMQWLEKRL